MIVMNLTKNLVLLALVLSTTSSNAMLLQSDTNPTENPSPLHEQEHSAASLQAVYVQRFNALDLETIADNDRGEAHCKSIGQEAFDAFKSLGYTSDEAFDLLKEVVHALHTRYQNWRCRLVERALDGIGDEEVRWCG
jgi:hypothetical protein